MRRQRTRATSPRTPRPEAPPPALNPEERLDRRQNAVNSASRSFTVAQKAHQAALDRFNDTSPTSADADTVAGDLRSATKELSVAWKALNDLCSNLS